MVEYAADKLPSTEVVGTVSLRPGRAAESICPGPRHMEMPNELNAYRRSTAHAASAVDGKDFNSGPLLERGVLRTLIARSSLPQSVNRGKICASAPDLS